MDNKLPIPKPTKEKNATSEIVKVLILAVISFVAGFALIFFFLRPAGPDVAPEELPPDGESAGLPADTPDTPAAPKPGAKVTDAIPPGETPDGVSQPDAPHYLKCWDKTGIESDGADCDRIISLENRFTERLYVVNECKNSEAGEESDGKLVVACEVNFDTNSISFWNGAASDVRNASDIGDCLRNRLSGIPLESIDHQFSRYRIYFGVEFGADKPVGATADNDGGASGNEMSLDGGPSEPSEGKGRLVSVIKDRVRVRRAPVNGEPFGKISTGNKVRLLKQQNDWCNILTPNNNEGWMICSALDI